MNEEKVVENTTVEEINAYYEGKELEAQDEGEDLIRIEDEEEA